MGCDIHAVMQFKRYGSFWDTVKVHEEYGGRYSGWGTDKSDEDVMPRIKEFLVASEHLHGRSYNLFSLLANVRNGSGFAGVDTGDALPFIQAGRGFPEDFKFDSHSEATFDSDSDREPVHEGRWMGDHSYGWVSLAELEAYDWSYVRTTRGILSLKQFQEWDRKSSPSGWSNGVWGPNVVTKTEHWYDECAARGIIENELHLLSGQEVYIKASWDQPVRELVKGFHDHTLPFLRSLSRDEAKDDVRIVFGFDS